MTINRLYFSTTSQSKAQHFQDFFSKHGVQILPVELSIPETQSIKPEEVVLEKLKVACTLTALRPLLVDDVGLTIPSLMGFPGALLKPIMELGGLGLLRELTASKANNFSIEAEFVCALAVALGTKARDNESILTCSGSMKGTLDLRNDEFMHDRATKRCFYPEGYDKTIADLELIDSALGFQHRFRALEELKGLLVTEKP
ncbi:MAG: hypothetical protein RJB66_1714 [Pseudomonadota bacterium]|jgi:inosine/xanthosine triphosphate pyrophosphatase family protein